MKNTMGLSVALDVSFSHLEAYCLTNFSGKVLLTALLSSSMIETPIRCNKNPPIVPAVWLLLLALALLNNQQECMVSTYLINQVIQVI